MGIDLAFATQLIADRHHVAGKTKGVMLGRQGFAVKPVHHRRLRMKLRQAGLTEDVSSMMQEDGFGETFFETIGFPKMQSMDASSYEGCNLVHDLNDPVPENLYGAFDVIVDGGTIEHVFNIPQALDNVFHMLGEEGVFISINGMTGWPGHGFYQFSPELVWRYWQDARKCEVLECISLPTDPKGVSRPAPDTGKTGARFKGRGIEGRWYLYYAVRRVAEANPTHRITNTAQGDYDVRWQAHSKCNP